MINKLCRVYSFIYFKWAKSKTIFLILPILLLMSCSTSKDVVSWNVELKEAEIPITDKCDPNIKLQSVRTPEKPKLLPATEQRVARLRVIAIPCQEGEKAPVYDIPVDRVKRITYVADPLQPPVQSSIEELPVIEGCCRVRDGIWFFDKIELKGFIGYRGSEDQVTYPTHDGYEVYESSFFGFDRGGSSLIVGFETMALWNVPFVDPEGAFQLGALSGVWPADESIFIPFGLYGRYTFKQRPSRYSDNCNTWFLYGTLGLPIDFETEAPIFSDNTDYQRYFYGVGIGYDWAYNCDMDISVDLGIRQMNLPLPPCTVCPNIPDDLRNPFRNSTAVLLRFGLIF